MSLLSFKEIAYHLGQTGSRTVTVSGELAAGGVLVVQGPSGSGKTTLLRILSRLQEALGGVVYWQGQDWSTIPGNYWRRQVYYLAQKPAFFDGTVLDNLLKPFQINLIRKEKTFDLELARRYLKLLVLDPGILEQDIRTASGGEASRLALVRALLVEPAVLLMDEPGAALDNVAREALLQVVNDWLKTPARGVIWVSHNQADAAKLPVTATLEIGLDREEG